MLPLLYQLKDWSEGKKKQREEGLFLSHMRKYLKQISETGFPMDMSIQIKCS